MPTTPFPSDIARVNSDEAEDSGESGRLDPRQVADELFPRAGRAGVGGADPADAGLIQNRDLGGERTPLARSAGGVGGGRPTGAAALLDGSVRRSLEALRVFPDSHSVAPPARITKARKVVEQVVDEALESLVRLAEVPQQRQSWQRQVSADVEAAARRGEDAPEKAERPDFTAQEDRAVAQARGLVSRARDARRAYDTLADELLSADSRTATLTKALSSAHAAAVQAAQDAQEKAEAAATALDALLNLPRPEGWERAPRQTIYLPRIEQHVAALEQELSRLDPEQPVLVNTGATRCDMATRSGLANSGDPAHRWSLYALERSEHFTVSSFTRSWPPMERVPGAHNYEAGAREPRY